MPPRKKAKARAASTPVTETQPKTPQDVGAGDHASPADEDRLNDPWTNDQETQLFKSMIKWKPTGLHKHFRMISIHNNMRSLGFATEEAQHTRIPGVWHKLDQLYDLHALDERENSYAFHEQPDPLDPDEAFDLPDFELPEDEFGELMWHQRFHSSDSDRSSSPPFIPVENDKELYHPGLGLLHGLPEGAKRQRTASVASTTTTAPKTTKSTRASRAATKAANKGTKARNTKAQSAVSGSTEEDDEDDEEDEDEEESEVEVAPTTRRTNRSGARAKAAPKRTRKR